MSNKDKLLVLIGLAQVFDKVIEKETLEMMLNALEDIPVEDLKKAATKCIQISKWMPTVAHLREATGLFNWEGADLSDHPRKQEIIYEIWGWMENNGYNRFADVLTQEETDKALVELGYEKGLIKSGEV